jgi:hypothetical protein
MNQHQESARFRLRRCSPQQIIDDKPIVHISIGGFHHEVAQVCSMESVVIGVDAVSLATWQLNTDCRARQ